ncbi:hypothetical protein Q3G72_018900 [Acer saccharum]|nr:hypothetical protein Q3G72_018900 [Acer saccharum]
MGVLSSPPYTFSVLPLFRYSKIYQVLRKCGINGNEIMNVLQLKSGGPPVGKWDLAFPARPAYRLNPTFKEKKKKKKITTVTRRLLFPDWLFQKQALELDLIDSLLRFSSRIFTINLDLCTEREREREREAQGETGTERD